MGTEENFGEIFRRLETTDRHIVDIQNKMLSIQKDVDNKFNTLNSNMLRMLGESHRNGNNVGSNESQTQAAWVRQAVGLTIAVVTILGFSITTFKAMIDPIWITLESEIDKVSDYKEYNKDVVAGLLSDFKNHTKIDAHEGAKVKIAQNELHLKSLQRDVSKLSGKAEDMSDSLFNVKTSLEVTNKLLNSEGTFGSVE